MANEQENQLNTLIIGFILLIVGIILLTAVSDSINAATELTTATNESIAIANNNLTSTNEDIAILSGSGVTANKDVGGLTFFGNTTLNTSSIFINFTTEVNFTQEGAISVVSNFSDGTYNISYFYNIANGTTVNDNVISVDFFGNTTINTSNSNINVGTQVNFTLAGVITVSGLNFSNDTYQITYDYQGDDYVVDSTSRTLLNLIPLFFVIGGVLLVGVGFAFRMGLISL